MMILPRNVFEWKANEYGTLLKEQYTNRIWTKQQAEISHGMAIVFHEIQTNSVGMQGAGFFTISHNFIGTVSYKFNLHSWWDSF